MHIPDGFLDAKTVICFSVGAVAGISLAVKKINKHIEEKHIPLLGVTAAFIFAAQMLNFPVAGGTSGHFMGGVLAAILLGPFSGLLVMTAVLIIQCFLFQDGGLTALGANIFNMGIMGSIGGYYLFLFLDKISIHKTAAIFLSAWASIVLAAACCALELSFSGTVPLKIVLPAMGSVHMLIGIGEGVITLFVYFFIKKTRPDLLRLKKI